MDLVWMNCWSELVVQVSLTCAGCRVLPTWRLWCIFPSWWGNNYTRTGRSPSPEPSPAPRVLLGSEWTTYSTVRDVFRGDMWFDGWMFQSRGLTWSLHGDFEFSAAGSFGVNFEIGHFLHPQTFGLKTSTRRSAGVGVGGCWTNGKETQDAG